MVNLYVSPILFTGMAIGNFPLSGFTRCLFLQALLEDEKVLVALTFDEQSVCKLQMTSRNPCPVDHPKHTGGRNRRSMVVSLHSTCAELLQRVHGEFCPL